MIFFSTNAIIHVLSIFQNLYNNTNGDWFDMAECCLIKTSNPGIPDMEKPRVKGMFGTLQCCQFYWKDFVNFGKK